MLFNDTNEMVSVSFENNHTWLGFGQKGHARPYLGIRCLAITQPFLPNRSDIFYWSSGDY